jgi:hypothetical protein
MDRYDTFYGRERRNHQDLMLDLIVNYGYLTPARVARDERHRQLLHDAALGRLPRSAEGTDWLSPLISAVRHRLGTFLIRLGTTLQGASPAASQLPGTNGAAVSP